MPETVLQQVSEALIEVPEVGLSVLGISHRSEWFAEIVTGLEQDIRRLLGLSEDYHVLFLQGGATQQFSMVPMTLLRGNSKSADYLHSGYWSGKALPEARREGNINVVWSGADENFVRLPDSEELQLNPDAAYLHYVSNETVEGLQFHELFGLDGVPRVCDMSSDFLSRPIQADQFSILYAHAQKNLGPAGVTVVIVSDEVLDSVTDDLPGFLNYRDQVESHSIYNTPPVFGIYVTHLVVRWLLEDVGGLESMEQINLRKARAIYNRIDGSDGFYAGRAVAASRSMMNVAFNLSTVKLEQEFLEASQAAGFSGLNGHRSIGGLRASIYNAMRLEAVDELIGFMEEFQFAHQGMQRRAG